MIQWKNHPSIHPFANHLLIIQFFHVLIFVLSTENTKMRFNVCSLVRFHDMQAGVVGVMTLWVL